MDTYTYGRRAQVEEIKNVVRQLVALSLLPKDEISEAFYSLVRNCTPNTVEILKESFEQYKNKWIEIVQPEYFSVYDYPRRNYSDARNQNRIFQHRMYPHPTPYQFISTFNFSKLKKKFIYAG